MHHVSATWACRKSAAYASLRHTTRCAHHRAVQGNTASTTRPPASIGDVQRSCKGWPAGSLWREALSSKLRSSLVRERSSASSGRLCPSSAPPFWRQHSRCTCGAAPWRKASSSITCCTSQRSSVIFAGLRCVVASPPWPASRTGLATAAPAVLAACPHAAKRRAARLASESRARLPVPPPPPHLR